MGLLGDGVLGIRDPDCDLDRVRRGYGLVFRYLVVGMGCWRDTLRAARVGRRPYPADSRILSGLTGLDVCDGLGMGCGGVGRYEVF